MKPRLLCDVSCVRVSAVNLHVLRRFFFGYSGFPPSLKSTQIGQLRATSLPVSILQCYPCKTKTIRNLAFIQYIVLWLLQATCSYQTENKTTYLLMEHILCLNLFNRELEILYEREKATKNSAFRKGIR